MSNGEPSQAMYSSSSVMTAEESRQRKPAVEQEGSLLEHLFHPRRAEESRQAEWQRNTPHSRSRGILAERLAAQPGLYQDRKNPYR